MTISAGGSVLAVVLHYKRADLTIRCVDHLLGQSLRPELLVVDNGSNDGMVDLLPTDRGVRCLSLAANVGFAAGMNLGMASAIDHGYDYVWLLNNDAFAEPMCLERLVRAAANDDACGLLTPLLLTMEGTEQHAGGIIDWQTATHRPLLAGEIASASGNDGACLTGTALLIRTSLLREIGLFAPEFFAYWEDVDLSVRATRSGYGLRAVSEAIVTHVGSASSRVGSPLVEFLMVRNAWLFLLRNAPHGHSRAGWLRFWAHQVEKAARYRADGDADLCAATLTALKAARRQEFGPPGPLNAPAGVDRLASLWPRPVRDGMLRCACWLDRRRMDRASPRAEGRQDRN